MHVVGNGLRQFEVLVRDAPVFGELFAVFFIPVSYTHLLVSRKLPSNVRPLCQNSCLFFFWNKLQNIVHATLHHATNLLDAFDGNILIPL